MGSRVFILLGLLFAVVLLISSEVSARDLAAEASIDDKKVDATEKANEVDGRGGYNGGHGGSYPGYGGGGKGGGGKGGGGKGGGRCYHGCCKYGYHGCKKCCSYDGEPVDTEP